MIKRRLVAPDVPDFVMPAMFGKQNQKASANKEGHKGPVKKLTREELLQRSRDKRNFIRNTDTETRTILERVGGGSIMQDVMTGMTDGADAEHVQHNIVERTQRVLDNALGKKGGAPAGGGSSGTGRSRRKMPEVKDEKTADPSKSKSPTPQAAPAKVASPPAAKKNDESARRLGESREEHTMRLMQAAIAKLEVQKKMAVESPEAKTEMSEEERDRLTTAMYAGTKKQEPQDEKAEKNIDRMTKFFVQDVVARTSGDSGKAREVANAVAGAAGIDMKTMTKKEFHKAKKREKKALINQALNAVDVTAKAANKAREQKKAADERAAADAVNQNQNPDTDEPPTTSSS